MSPTVFTAIAERFFDRRWWFLALSAASVMLTFAAFMSGSQRVASMAAICGMPMIAVPWAMLCACIWFHPVKGNLRPGSRFVASLSPLMQTGLRWYAAIFLQLFVLVGAVIAPLMLLYWR